jgi:hypothetical protein
MANRESQGPGLTLRRGLVAGSIGLCAAGLGWIVAHLLVDASRQVAPWVLPVVVVGAFAIALIIALVWLPSFSRRA